MNSRRDDLLLRLGLAWRVVWLLVWSALLGGLAVGAIAAAAWLLK